MAVFHLVRHAVHVSPPDILAGRTPGIHLSERGRRDAIVLAKHLSREPVAAVLSSPRERALETAAAISDSVGIAVAVSAALDEIDFGGWTGLSFATLDDQPLWRKWNGARSLACPPGGETMQALQQRVMTELLRLADDLAGDAAVLVSHAEPIRAALLHALGMPLDHWNRIDIQPASVSTIVIDGWTPRVTRLNETPCAGDTT
jgi:broad specificity phosphatase PhoE